MRQGILTQDADGTPRWNGKVVVYDFDSHRWVYPPAPEPRPLEWLQTWLEARIGTLSRVNPFDSEQLRAYDHGRQDVLRSVLDRVKELQ